MRLRKMVTGGGGHSVYPGSGPLDGGNTLLPAWLILMIFPCVLGSTFRYIRVCPGLSFATKRIGPPCCTLFTFLTCCSLQIILSQNYLLPLISVLAENTLLKTACHFLLLLIGFDTLTYQKDYDRSPTLVGHQDSFLAPLPGSEAPLVGGIW